jgi:alpha-tubulin suppressor-like RCC1 family protein
VKWLVALAVLGGCDLVYSLDRPQSGWREVEPANHHACGLTVDGALWCWGGNDQGQVGTGDELPIIDAPAQIAGTWREMSSTLLSTCAIRDDATLWCWGSNGGAQLGIGSMTGTRIPKQLSGTWTAVDTGFFHACGIDEDRHLWCWGSGGGGQLGDGQMATAVSPVRVDDSAWTAVAAGGAHTCGLRDDATLWCWGDSAFAPLGDPALPPKVPTPAPIGTETWSAVVALLDSTCGITTSRRLRCWGMNGYGQLGIAEGDGLTPTAVTVDGRDYTDWVGLGAGTLAACGIRANGTAWCWGVNDRGQLAHDDLFVIAPTQVEHPANGDWARVAAGTGNVCLVDTEGRAWCAGNNGFAELAEAGGSPRVPARLPEHWPVIDAGDRVTCGIRDGMLACAGSGAARQLAQADVLARQRMTPIAGSWTTVTGGSDHQCALAADGAAWCWGSDFFSTLGDGGAAEDSSEPVPVAGPQTFRAIAAGSFHTCGIDIAGAMHCWGNNMSGQLGNGTVALAPSPVPVTSAIAWTELAVGGDHSCGLNASGAMRCWGSNETGEVGDGTLMDRRGPTTVSPPTLVQIAAGSNHTCGVAGDNSLWCWGDNLEGQLGIQLAGFATYQTRPATHPENVWSAVAAGAAHTCAIRTDGTLWCWGSNSRGQLGDGTLATRNRPVRVEGEGWLSVTCGTDHTCGTRADNSTWCWGNNTDGATATGTAWSPELREIVAPKR